MVHVFYHPTTYIGNDFIGPVTTYDFPFISGAPLTKNNYLTLFRPYDSYVWGFLIASVVTISLSLILINKIHNKISDEPYHMRESALQSIDRNSYHNLTFKFNRRYF